MSYLIGTLYGLYGVVVGSFLNVCICRIPKKEDFIRGRSHCMVCGNVLKWYELIPLVSYLIQGGTCRYCKSRISIQYPFIEAVNGIAWVWIYVKYGFCLESLIFCPAASVLLVLSVIDIRTMEIPDGCNLFLAALGVIRLVTDREHWGSYVIGLFAVSIFFLLLNLFTGGNGMGGGDIKLMAAAGLLLGWKQVLLAAVLACILGTVIHTALMLICKKGRQLAFGPYLACGILLCMLYGEELLFWYWHVLSGF